MKISTLLRRPALLLVSLATIAFTAVLDATPSTTFWAPSTPYLQPFGVLHLGYDSYFDRNFMFPTDYGITIGLLPLKAIQLEAGVDLFYPSPWTLTSGDKAFPAQLNGKIGTPEDTFFKGQPGWSFGIFGFGFEPNINDPNIIYAMIGKTMLQEWGPLYYLGTIAIGGYVGLNKSLMKSSDGKLEDSGLIASWTSPSIPIKYIDHILLCWDIMTGKNAFTATGGGIYVYFTPKISLLFGPVYFFDHTAAGIPNIKDDTLFTVQLDVDVDFNPPAK